ncbi:NADPH-dependent 7-cyano-7-deazaguanine reductase QueF [Trinickia terrae]|uniref:NADPH-dependent 7-cyano-7-deazaguanine reductase n=1 Tax=Trinickia terrae TaxID=2571161 RepID=A0A4U1IG24_9BURK|nr:NADPH-dependent 7-cyano-7-deazaguanine reductase QueF [Trinickia terrae]TKC92637.1 NADPH-dependent 7-cyano-7-deazaguanine reductase QueF [Trinickia terrae]
MELGKTSVYESKYNPERLFAIPRRPKREELGITGELLPFVGYDLWNHYEVSWLDQRGKPQVATAQIAYPCDSEFIIESKSMKLYFNSLNNTRFESIDVLRDTIAADLSSRLKANVSVVVNPLQDQMHRIISPLEGVCIDDAEIDVEDFALNPQYLETERWQAEEMLYSNLLKSNCLVTGQPDWGSVWIKYRGKKISREGLLRYIVSFREHHEFHEQCVERIFVDIMRMCEPASLTVGARYTRRGGIDINPVRSTQNQKIANPRLIRQ